MWGPGGPSCFVRWICHLPAGFVGFTTISYYYGLVDVPEDLLDELGTGHAFVLGMQLNGVVGVALFAWNFFQFIASSKIRGVLLWLTGLIDFALALLLSVGCAKIASFLPHTIAACGHAPDWRNTTDGRNLFVELVEEGHFDDARAPCKEMVTGWIVTIVLLLIYYGVGIMNMSIGYRCVYPDLYGTKYNWAFAEYDVPEIIAKPVFTLVIVVVENCRGVVIVVSRLAPRIYRRTRLFFREEFPSYINRIQKIELSAVAPRGYELVAGVNRDPIKPLPLEIVYMISHLVHQTDLVSLYQSSWALRTAFFGEAYPRSRLDAMRRWSCQGEKSSCAVCRSQICRSCTIDDNDLGISTHLRHLNNCHPYCTSCYWRLRCGPGRREFYFRKPNHQSFCHVIAGDGSSVPALPPNQGLVTARSVTPPPVPRSVCGRCSTVALAHRRKATEARDEEAVRVAWRGETECKVCCARLGKTALRWWVCSRCGADCPDEMHPLTGLGRH